MLKILCFLWTQCITVKCALPAIPFYSLQVNDLLQFCFKRLNV